eukprot:TRINITY_DN2863_c0_g1_i1.p1 TRINITY_DN2863_c0_g1~~TRINITY_DN2863_c0_g1_i1.p1  ORF type:complete len:132 (-),score=20.69 TRINITY_DN2863_c0_g1_i1:242-637(-)
MSVGLLLRPAVIKVIIWGSIGIGYLVGTIQNTYFKYVLLPQYLREEELKRDRIYKRPMDEKDKLITNLYKKLQKDEVPSDKPVTEDARHFHFADLENDELVDRWINFINQGTEIQVDDSTVGDLSFQEKKP